MLSRLSAVVASILVHQLHVLCAATSLGAKPFPGLENLPRSFWHELSSPFTEVYEVESFATETGGTPEPRPFFEDPETNITVQLGAQVYMHCRVQNLQDTFKGWKHPLKEIASFHIIANIYETVQDMEKLKFKAVWFSASKEFSKKRAMGSSWVSKLLRQLTAFRRRSFNGVDGISLRCTVCPKTSDAILDAREVFMGWIIRSFRSFQSLGYGGRVLDAKFFGIGKLDRMVVTTMVECDWGWLGRSFKLTMTTEAFVEARIVNVIDLRYKLKSMDGIKNISILNGPPYEAQRPRPDTLRAPDLEEIPLCCQIPNVEYTPPPSRTAVPEKARQGRKGHAATSYHFGLRPYRKKGKTCPRGGQNLRCKSPRCRMSGAFRSNEISSLSPEVSWVRRRGDELHLLTIGRDTYASDSRFSLAFEKPNDWRLFLSSAIERDGGLYECQVSAHPPLIRTVHLTVSDTNRSSTNMDFEVSAIESQRACKHISCDMQLREAITSGGKHLRIYAWAHWLSSRPLILLRRNYALQWGYGGDILLADTAAADLRLTQMLREPRELVPTAANVSTDLFVTLDSVSEYVLQSSSSHNFWC
ncbi:hypothetical protein WH47_08605 [Habropoda laboriosa]|uniref:Ig-like domain-containing protein n=1 Tax=Habropoda laboriosa TaxID=597456 RepID=A0A0L7QP49_9HYME|nr:hypothetical protein WH47_08605 [Habropoda laboriosa]